MRNRKVILISFFSLSFIFALNVSGMVNLDSIEVLKTDSISENKFCPKAVDLIIQKSQ